jgi:hypothetical protein
MADNVSTVADANATLPASTAIATDDVGGVHYQRIKLDIGADGASTPVTAAAPLPVTFSAAPLPTGAATEAGLDDILAAITALGLLVDTVEAALADITTPSDTQPVSAASLPLPTGAATQTTLALAKTALDDILTKLNASIAVTGTFWQATQPVSGTFWQATQPVSAASLPLPTGAATEAESEAITAATIAVGTAVAAVETAIETLGTDAEAADVVYLAKLDDLIEAVEDSGSKTLADPAPDTTATELKAANANRKVIVLYNAGSPTVYLGKDNTVTSSTGLPLVEGASLTDEYSTDAWWGITASGTGDIRVIEVA